MRYMGYNVVYWGILGILGLGELKLKRYLGV